MAAVTLLIIFENSGTAFAGIAAAALHEAGHIAVMVYFGTAPEAINFNLFDIAIIDGKRHMRSTGQDLCIICAGVLFNTVFSAIFFAVYCVFKAQLLYTLFAANLFLGVFNALPVESLDGGQALYVVLLNKIGERRACFYTLIVSFIVVLPMAILGFLLVLKSAYNYSLLLVSCYLTVMLLLKKSRFL